MDTQQSGSGKKRPWLAFNIIKREGTDKEYWHKVGIAWPNRDGSFKIVLDSMPFCGEIFVREEKEWERERARSQQKGPLASAAMETEQVHA